MLNKRPNYVELIRINDIIKSDINCFASINIVLDKLEIDGNLPILINTFYNMIDSELRFAIKGCINRA